MGSDPLSLASDWPAPPPLLTLAEALDQSLLISGLSREELLRRLLADLPAALRLPVLALLPRGWRCRPALLPERLRGLAALLGEELLSPTLLAALADELAHLLPAAAGSEGLASPLDLWRSDYIRWRGERRPLPADLAALQAPLASEARLPQQPARTEPPLTETAGAAGTQEAKTLAAGREATRAPTSEAERSTHGMPLHAVPLHAGERRAPVQRRLLHAISGPLQWHNQGLQHLQSEPCRLANQLLAQVFNRLAANLTCGSDDGGCGDDQAWSFAGCHSGTTLLKQLIRDGADVRARLRASVASFGLGASLPSGSAEVLQVPLALPCRTGLLGPGGEEQQALLPHAALELELRWPQTGQVLLLQYYQGTEGFCGWQGLNDLHRPWQNDRDNGTVRYLGEPFSPEELEPLLALSDVIALLHNREAQRLHLRVGGYGTIGFCLDSTALLQQAMAGRCDLFPVLLSGVWRERLQRAAAELGCRPPPLWSSAHDDALRRYRRALEDLPTDLSLHGPACADAWRRLLASSPEASPFQLVRDLRARAQTASAASTA